MNVTATDVLTATRPLGVMGIDPSSRLGAHLLAARLRMYWIERGLDVPSEVILTVPPEKRGINKTDSVYGVRLDHSKARKLSSDDIGRAMMDVYDEIEPLIIKLSRKGA